MIGGLYYIILKISKILLCCYGALYMVFNHSRHTNLKFRKYRTRFDVLFKSCPKAPPKNLLADGNMLRQAA